MLGHRLAWVLSSLGEDHCCSGGCSASSRSTRLYAGLRVLVVLLICSQAALYCHECRCSDRPASTVLKSVVKEAGRKRYPVPAAGKVAGAVRSILLLGIQTRSSFVQSHSLAVSPASTRDCYLGYPARSSLTIPLEFCCPATWRSCQIS